MWREPQGSAPARPRSGVTLGTMGVSRAGRSLCLSLCFCVLCWVLWLVLDVAFQNHLPEWLNLGFSQGQAGTMMPPASSPWKVEQHLCPHPRSSRCALFHRALDEWPGGLLLPQQWQWHPDQDSQHQLPPAEFPHAPGAQGDGQLLADKRLLHNADGAW